MTEWCTIESDPGVFTELIKNIGVKGVQVEEILDMDILETDPDPVYGLIFLFKYLKNSGYNPKVLDYYDKDLFFARQVVTNACATQAILGILMNNSEKIDIGPTLTELKNFSKEMDPQMKGLSISNCEKIRNEHNKFSHPEPFIFTKEVAKDGDDVFHFVAYIHFKNAIYEIDGLQEGPILIEGNVTNEEWIKKVKPKIVERINLFANNEIKFNLLAVVPDRLEKAKKIENDLIKRKNYIEGLINGSINKDEKDKDLEEYNKMSVEELNNSLKGFISMIKENEVTIKDEEIKIEKYKLENERRQHNYIPFIFEVLKLMGEKNVLEEAYQEAYDLSNKKKEEKKDENKK